MGELVCSVFGFCTSIKLFNSKGVKKEMKKRIFAFIMCVVLCMTLCIPAYATESSTTSILNIGGVDYD